MRNISFIALSAALALAGCGPTDPKPPAAAAPAAAPAAVSKITFPTVDVQTASPDQAVKSWWRYVDALAAFRESECKKHPPSPEWSQATTALLTKLADGVLLAAMTPSGAQGCQEWTYEREIDEVKMESETRALVFARIKNSTPLAPGAQPDQFDTKQRAEGYRFRYLVEKSGGQWKVAQIYEFNEAHKALGSDMWRKRYDTPKPAVPIFVAQP